MTGLQAAPHLIGGLLNRTSHDEIDSHLTPGARSLFCEMVDTHLSASGNRHFLRLDAWSGSFLRFSGNGRAWENVDIGALDDLVDYGLLRRESTRQGRPNYRVTGDGELFYQWLLGQHGEAINQTDEQVRRFVEGDEFTKSHVGASHHLREAFGLLWDGSTSDQTISEIGDHLRKALMDVTDDVVGPGVRGKQEKPIERLKAWVVSREGLGRREQRVLSTLIDLADATLALDHRLNHVRDEADKGEPAPTWEEARRAAFTTAFVAHEIVRSAR